MLEHYPSRTAGYTDFNRKMANQRHLRIGNRCNALRGMFFVRSRICSWAWGISTPPRRRRGSERAGQTRRKRVLCAVCQFIDLSDDVPVQITHLTFKLHDIASSNVVIGLLFWERMGGDDRQSCRNESIAANVYLFCQMMMGA